MGQFRSIYVALAFASLICAQVTDIVTLSDDNFVRKIYYSDLPWLVRMCDLESDACVQSEANFETLKGWFLDEEIRLGFLDCEEYPDNCLDFDITEEDYPTFILFKSDPGDGGKPIATARFPDKGVSEPRNLHHWINFMQHGPVTALNALFFDSWISTRHSVVLFYDARDSHDQAKFVGTILLKLTEHAGKRYSVGKVDCAVNADVCKVAGVENYPVMRFYSKNMELEKAHGEVFAYDLSEVMKVEQIDDDQVAKAVKAIHSWARDLLQEVKKVRASSTKNTKEDDVHHENGVGEKDRGKENDASSSWFSSSSGHTEEL